MNPATQLLQRIQRGDLQASDELLPLVYVELRELAARRLAQERPGQTLQGTALVHEAYLRLVGQPSEQKWDGRGHFFAAAAEAMRRILVESARRRRSLKRGGGAIKSASFPEDFAESNHPDAAEVLAIHELLEEFAGKSPRKAEVVKCRYFLGCTMQETADALGIALATAEEDWTYARAWLRRRYLGGEESKAVKK